MPHPAHHSLFHRPRIWAPAQHLQVMVGFDHQHVATAQMILHTAWHVSQISADSDFYTFAAKREANRVDGIMGNGKGSNGYVADLEGASCFKRLQPLQNDAVAGAIARIAAIRLVCSASDIDRNLQTLGEYMQSGDVVTMFMRDQNRVDALRRLSTGCQTPQQLSARQSGIHQ